jgi:hypothetical protein
MKMELGHRMVQECVHRLACAHLTLTGMGIQTSRLQDEQQRRAR